MCVYKDYNATLKQMCDFFDAQTLYSSSNLTGRKRVGGQLMLQMMENTIVNEYSNYETIDAPTQSADLTQVPIPWRFMWGTSDMLCP